MYLLHNPKISVLMGAYNCANTLETAVRSIREQTYPYWNMIICDDGSEDDTYTTACKLAEADSRITVIQNQKNCGLAQTLNNCLALADGEFIARMDGDDFCAPSRFLDELEVFGEYPDIAIVGTGMNLYDETGYYGHIMFPQRPQPENLINGTPFCHASTMIRAAALRAVGGYRSTPDTERVEDYDLWIRMFAAGYTGYNLQQCLYSMLDDRAALNRRKFTYRINEYKLKRKLCRTYKLGFIGYLKALRPLVVGLLPNSLYAELRAKRYRG